MARPLLGDEEAAAAARVLASGWIMQGPEVEAFERELAAFVGAPHACAVSSGTAALHLALLAVGVRPGDEVVTVSHSFIATANSVRHSGAVPIFVDIEPGSYNLNVAKIEPVLSERTRAILCVHQLGMPCDLAALLPLAAKHRLPVVEDAACALGSEIAWRDDWQRIGRPHGDAACFSFHPRKLITTGEGGAVTSRDAKIDARVRSWRAHGVGEGIFGFNYRMTDLQAAIGRVQLGRLPGILAERRRLVDELRRRLPGVTFPVEPATARSNWQSLCVRFASWAAAQTVKARLEAAGVAVRPGLVNAHADPAHKVGIREPLVESERAARECLLLPLPANMSAAELDRLITAVVG